MANKMAEFPGKLAIFRQKAASLREAARVGGLLKISELRGGYFGYTPPCRPPVLHLSTEIIAVVITADHKQVLLQKLFMKSLRIEFKNSF